MGAQLPKACIIGAGCSGFTTAKRLQDYGIPFDVFEASDDIGGTWYYNNPNGMSACYKSLHIDTSKWRLAFEDFPVPDHWPDYPHHAQLLQYFHDYVDHFDLRKHIRFNTRVEKAQRKSGGGWTITLSTGRIIPTRWVGEQHVREDLGFIPSFADWVKAIRPEPWMGRSERIEALVDPHIASPVVEVC